MPFISPDSARHLAIPPFTDQLPEPIWFRLACMPAEATYPLHQHAWGEFVYSYSGVMEVKLTDHHFLVPPQYGVWLPPDETHIGMNQAEACHCSVYIARPHCELLPAKPCALTVGPLLRAMLDHLRQHPPVVPRTPADTRMLQVMVDLLGQAPCAGSYLPMSTDPVLGKLLRWLELHPEDHRPLTELAREANTSERTLIRRCQRDLGMSFSEWRQRLAVIKAMPLLEAGQTVETIALDLGYNSASAFISMFRRLMDITPDEFRKRAASLA